MLSTTPNDAVALVVTRRTEVGARGSKQVANNPGANPILDVTP